MMEPILIQLNEQAGLARTAEPIRLGVPFPQGQLDTTETLRLSHHEDGRDYPLQTTVTGRWHDGSIRWLLVETLVDLAPGKQLTLRLAQGPDSQADRRAIQYTPNAEGMLIDTGALRIQLDNHQLNWRPLRPSEPPGDEGHTSVQLTDSEGKPCVSRVDGWEVVSHSTDVCLEMRAKGDWLDCNEQVFARFDCRLRFYQGTETVAADICLHNPKRALHPGGLWDLGDPGSIHFQSLCIVVRTDHPISKTLKTQLHGPLHSYHNDTPIVLHQDSSGGDQWHSRNHMDANGQVTTRFRGYQIRTGEEILAHGDRASPILSVDTAANTYHFSMRQFWQNFPSALKVDASQASIALFPAESGPYELQGGERKTHTCYLHYGDRDDGLNWTQAPLIPVLPAKVYERAAVFPWFSADYEPGPLDELIKEGLDGPHNFFAKRETIDEYGWRNFGDIFADHETLYQKEGEEPYISHYNNQYDAIYGFARQFALTGDPRWFELMDDLARHVTDIDIYHTDEDRVEYNNGLFWHTDHYLDAHTATHRTFTKASETSSIPGQLGGGPAEEHCYSTGLLFHHYLIGETSSKECVSNLADWITNQREGDKTILGQLDIVRRRDLPNLIQMIKGVRPANRQYPFTRGTGNYVNTLLDAHIIEQNKDRLYIAEKVILSTVHPDDDPDSRQLLEIEVSWSYLIFLSSLVRYLLIKAEEKTFDGTYIYVLLCFKKYVLWISQSEKKFLESSYQIEYLNHTWVAQDVRKAMLLFQAGLLFSDEAKYFNERAFSWLDYVTSTLKKSPEKHFSRIQVILLQNYGPHEASNQILRIKSNKRLIAKYNSKEGHDKKLNLTFPDLIIRIWNRISVAAKNFKLRREISWLNNRLGRS